MPSRVVRKSVGLLIVATLAVAGGLTWWSTAATLAVPPPTDGIDLQLTAAEPPAGRAGIDPAAQHWRLPLQEQLFDSPPEPTIPEPMPEPEPPPVRRAPPTWKLLGTIIESRGNTAILETAPGKVQVRRAGQNLSGVDPPARVFSVEENQVTLSYQGGEVTLELVAPPTSPILEQFDPR